MRAGSTRSGCPVIACSRSCASSTNLSPHNVVSFAAVDEAVDDAKRIALEDPSRSRLARREKDIGTLRTVDRRWTPRALGHEFALEAMDGGSDAGSHGEHAFVATELLHVE